MEIPHSSTFTIEEGEARRKQLDVVADQVLQHSYHGNNTLPSRTTLSQDTLDELQENAAVLTNLLEKTLRRTSGLLRTITQGEVSVLFYLDSHTRNTVQAHIAERVGLTKPRITQVVNSLEEKGYVVRERDEEDARKVHVRITTAGRHAVNEHRVKMNLLVENYLLMLGSDTQQQDAMALFEKTYAILRSFDLDEASAMLAEV